MTEPADLAGRLLKVEQQLEAYEKLHTEELAELKQILNECKRKIVNLSFNRAMNSEELSSDLSAARQSADRADSK